MERNIKTRAVIKDIKTLDKRAGITRSIKQAGIKSKDTLNDIAAPKQKPDKSASYAEDKTEAAIKSGASNATRGAGNAIKGTVIRAKDARQLSKDAAATTVRAAAKRTTEAGSATAKTAADTAQTGRRGVKTASRSIRNARATRKAAKGIGRSTQAAKATVKGAGAAKTAARNASLATRAAARSAATMAKAAARGIAVFARMAIAAAKSLGVAIAALGGTAVAVILVICLVGLIAVSAFGIFFTGDDMGDGNPSLREVVSEINLEHTDRINEIKAQNPHDEVSLGGMKTPWKEVLALYAVKVTTDAQDPLDVVTLDAKRQQILRDVFWEMNSISYSVEERQVEEIVLEEDESGNQVETTKTSTSKTLHITLSNKSATDMASILGFNTKQNDLLNQLLDKRHDSTWQSVLFGISRGSSNIVEIAAEQIGNVGGQPFWSWYGFSGRVEWCACFVSWCANEAGYIEAGVIPKFSYCPTGVQWFKDAGLWQDRGYAPQPGDIIFFDWGGDGTSDHVGIVESCDGSIVRTIEGNTSDSCLRRSYGINSSSIMGYGTPLY